MILIDFLEFDELFFLLKDENMFAVEKSRNMRVSNVFPKVFNR